MNLKAADYYSDLRALIDDLGRRGKLYRWSRPVNKDTELMPLMRLQYRGLPDEKRQALLFENVFDSNGKKYDVRVLTGVYGSSREILGLGMGCEDVRDIYEKWHRALANPLEPDIVNRARVQEEVYSGAKLN